MNELPQNMKAVLQGIGEESVLMQLSMRTLHLPNWRVFKNYIEPGCDIVLINTHTNKTIKVEVKTRQNIVTKRASKNALHFTLTESEQLSSDYVVAYWFDRNDYFIIPTSELTKVGKASISYKFIAYLSKATNAYNEQTAKYLDQWDTILNHM